VRHSPINRNFRPPVSSRLASHRSGAFMLEVVVGAVLLGVFLATVGPMFRWIHDSKRTNERHLLAMQELSTQMEQLAALPRSALTTESVQSIAISESTKTRLPDSQLAATLSPDDGMQRVMLTISWINDAGMAVEPKRLTAWFPLESKGETK
jgi:hypothetical protein